MRAPARLVLVPVGQPLGSSVSDQGQRELLVRIATATHRLGPGAARVWRQLHAVTPGALHGLDRAQLLPLLDQPAEETLSELQQLITSGLVVELSTASPRACAAFADAHRLLPLQTCIGSSESDPGAFTLVAGQTPTVQIDEVLLQVLVAGPTEGSLASTCTIASGALGATPGLEHLGDPAALVGHVVERLGAPLAVHGCYLDRAIRIESPGEVLRPRADPQAVVADEDDRREHGTYGVGYLVGARYGRFGLQDIAVRLGREMVSLADMDSWLTWSWAHGFVEDGRVVDEQERVLDAAARAGVQVPRSNLRHLSNAGLVEEPDGAEIVEMAATHRLEPLLAGVGPSPDDLGSHLLGVDEDRVTAVVTLEELEVWRTAPLYRSLLEAAVGAGRAGSVDELVGYLRVVQSLSVKRAAYLDVVRTP